jgi:hypothetical protein
LSSNNFLGFGRWDAETNLRFAYQRAGGTQAEIDDCHTLVADTYLKAGFRYYAATKTCGIFINGELFDTVTSAETGATPWPSLYMNFINSVKMQAEREGLDQIFKDAGCTWGHPGCSMCVGTNGDLLKPGERSASTSNRNFEGRQGRGARTHLVSPAMAAAAAVTGTLTDVRRLLAAG